MMTNNINMSTLSNEEMLLVLEDFPKFELCYELIKHKKVHNASVIMAIPEGKKCYAWFTSYKGTNVCFNLELNDNKQIINVKIIVTGFDDKLAFGTIFYGTLFETYGFSCFCIEDLYFYKGKTYISLSYLNKLELLRKILTNEISQIALTSNYTVFGLPLINNDFNLLLNEIQMLPYKISEIKFRYFDSKKIETIKYFKPNSHNNSINRANANANANISHSNSKYSNNVFKVTADIEPDIYNLFIYNNITGTEEYYDIAFIPDYKTSVMMNKLFRKIKENDNLDAIEESDDESEFEDKREDKFVYLDRSFKMKCEYNQKFKRWCPVSLASKNDKIVSIKNINS